MTTDEPTRECFQYFVVRCVPRVDREEFINVGVVLYSQALDFLGAAFGPVADRARALDLSVDLAEVGSALDGIDAVCRGDASAGPMAKGTKLERFGWLSSPRSTVVQPGPVHGGITDDAAAQLAHLLAALVT